MAIVTGTSDPETLPGTKDDDTITGGGGNDKAVMAAGDDIFIWNPGDDSDVVEGGSGSDTLLFNGSNASERFSISGNAGHAQLTRDVAAVLMDMNDVERLELNVVGGTDTIVVNDLTGTDLKVIAIDLSGAGTPGVADGASDSVTLNASGAANTITITEVAGLVTVTGLPATVTIAAAEASDGLSVNGLGGNDKIDASALPAATIALIVDGGSGNDAIIGSQAGDVLIGGDGNDVIAGGRGDDVALLGADSDRFVWNPGDGSDVVEGQDGVDTLAFNGSNASENIDISANGGRIRLFRDVANVVMDINDVERIELQTSGGSDRVTVNDVSGTDLTDIVVDLAATVGGSAADKVLDAVVVNATQGDDTIKIASAGSKIVTTGLAAQVTIEHADKTDVLVINGLGAPGGDTDTIDASKLTAGKIALQINGGLGDDVITGSAGDDTVNGNDGNDNAKLGAGSDTFAWNPGDDNDTVDGGAGDDTLRFNGANIAEKIDVSDNAGGIRFTRDVAAVTMDLAAVETIAFKAFGGADTISVHDLSGTDVEQVAIDLGSQAGGGDGAADAVIADAGAANNTIKLSQTDPAIENVITVTGLPATLSIRDAEGANDSLVINGRDGNDTIDASALAAAAILLKLDGGSGNDTLAGGQGSDVIIGGDGNDTVTGDNGNDVALLGAGDDAFVWGPGDGNDTVEGQADFDTLHFNTSAAAESMDIAANGGRVRLTRDVANIVMDLDDVERIEIHALAGADRVTVNDLSGTDVTEVLVDLAATVDGSVTDKAPDTVIVNATQGTDAITIASAGGKIVTTGLPASVTIDHADKTDILIVNALGGDETIDAGKLAAGKLVLQINGGIGIDTVIGSAGDDTVNGNDGNDIALLGAGNDTFVWNPGDDNDTIEGQAGTDTLHFNGANIAERIDIFANGGRAMLSRDVANVTMDNNDVERIAFKALGGADTITVGDLTGTDVNQVSIDLASGIGGGDGAADFVILNGAAGKETITVTDAGGVVTVAGLPAQVIVLNGEPVQDRLVINGRDGDDRIDASKLAGLSMSIDGGTGNDVIIGSAGEDSLSGGDDNDTITGGGGRDIAVLGAGDDLFVWSSGDGADTLEGQAGTDTLRVLGSTSDDGSILVSANGSRAVVVDGITIVNADDFERIEIRPLDGADTIFVTDMSGTDVTEVAIDLAATPGGSAPDDLADSVIQFNAVGGTTTVTTIGGKMMVNSPAQQTLTVEHWGKTDLLTLNGTGDVDVFDASTVSAGKMTLQIFGEAGADIITGSAGDDIVDGGAGNDAVNLGAGDDRYLWSAADESDTVNGGAGKDTAVFNGSNNSELFGLTAADGHAQIFFGFGAALIDLDDVERVEINPSTAVDLIQVGDLSGTDVNAVAINLDAPAGDGSADQIFVVGSAETDSVSITATGTAVSIKGLSASIAISGAEPFETLELDVGAGNDTINAGSLKIGAPILTLNGEAGNDKLTGGLGADQLFGGADNDTLKGGGNDDLLFGEGGRDTIDGGAGNDTISGGAGDDTINAALDSDFIRYNSVNDGHDTVTSFDGNAAGGGQDQLDLDGLFDSLGIATAVRAGRVSITDNGSSVDIAVDTDGDTLLDLTVATLKTIDIIAVGEDVLVGTL